MDFFLLSKRPVELKQLTISRNDQGLVEFKKNLAKKATKVAGRSCFEGGRPPQHPAFIQTQIIIFGAN